MEKTLEQKEIKIIIPACCREGREDCPHVAKPPEKKKKNIGM